MQRCGRLLVERRDGALDVGVQHGHATHGRTAEIFVNQPTPHAGEVGHNVLRHDDVVENCGRHGRLFEGLDELALGGDPAGILREIELSIRKTASLNSPFILQVLDQNMRYL